MNINHYTYRVTWSQEDREHVGLCAEFPSLSWLAPTPEKALAGIRRLVGEVVADMQATGEPVPDPLSERQYSALHGSRSFAGASCACYRGRRAGREHQSFSER
jgi:predicted RNase H-like HicB family nuclease